MFVIRRKNAGVAGEDKRIEIAGDALLVTFILVMAVQLAALAGGIWFTNLSQTENRRFNESQAELHYLLLALVDPANAGPFQHGGGFLTTRDVGIPAFNAHLARFQGLMIDGPDQRRDLQALTQMGRERLGNVETVRQLVQAGKRDEALALIARQESKPLMPRIRACVARLQHSEAAHNHAVEEVTDRRQKQLAVVLISGLVLFSLVVAGAAALVRASLAQLKLERSAAEQANAAKSAFLALMSHELRTPMNGILGMAHALGAGALDAVQRQSVDLILKSGDGLMVVLNDILDLSKIEAGKIEVENAPFDLAEMVELAVALWRTAAQEKGLYLSVEIEPSAPTWVRGDVTRVRQIVLNLLSNAFKFTQTGGVAVRVSGASGLIRISVADTGAGINPAAASRLFEPFVQEDASTTRRFGGTGLGLAICRRLALLMGGDLVFDSVLGQGSIFTATLALSECDAQVSPTAEEDDAVALPPLHVLVADDNPTNRIVAKAFLDAVGATAELADNGEEALAALRRSHFDLVLMDIHMPVMDGSAAMREVREGGVCRVDMPIVALTADAMDGDRERYLLQGFDDHLAKPIEPRAFIALLNRVAKGMAANGRPPTANGRAIEPIAR